MRVGGKRRSSATRSPYAPLCHCLTYPFRFDRLAVVCAKPPGCPNPINRSRRLPARRRDRDRVQRDGIDAACRRVGEGEGEARIYGNQREIPEILPARKFGAEFLTYVLWAVSPEGRAVNLGEVLINSAGKGRLKVSSPIQTFSLLVTAEPYFGVRIPSELLVLENEILRETKGKRFAVHEYSLMKTARYQKLSNPLFLSTDLRNQPLDIYEARNALGIAQSNAADRYAPEIYGKAAASLKMAESHLRAKDGQKLVISMARQAVQFSEDALTLARQRQEEERAANERKAQEAAERRAEAEAHQEALRRAQAETAKARAEAEQARAQAAEEAERGRAELEAQRRAQADNERDRAVSAQREAEERLRRQRRRKASCVLVC